MGHGEAHADGDGRVYQAFRDLHVTELHAAAESVAGPDSVRVPQSGAAASPLRDRCEVRAALTSAGPGVDVVHGLGGCGKTAVAHAVFDELAAGGGVVCLWVNAGSAVSLRAGMLAVALDRGASQEEVDAARQGRRPAADLVWRCLDGSDQPWFLVLDGADDPALLTGQGWLRASGRGTVLVTTRHGSPGAWPGARLHRLDVLTVPDAVGVLQDLAADTGDAAALEGLARSLGCHPLALMLAGVYLGDQFLEPVSVEQYVERLSPDPGSVLDLGAEPGERDLRRLVRGTWQLSLDALARRGVPEATTLMRLLACFAAEPLPVSVLAGVELAAADPPLAAERANSALRALVSQSLLSVARTRGRAGRRVEAHRLLLDTVAAATPVDQRGLLADAAARLLGDAFTREGPEAAGALTPHALALLRRTGTPGAVAVARTLRRAHHAAGDYFSAHVVAEEVAATTREADDQVWLGRCLTTTGRFAEAEGVLRAAAGAARGPTALDAVHERGLALYGLGRFADDESCMREAVEGRAALLGGSHPDTLTSRACLAEAIGEQGRWHEAEPLARANLASSERAFGASSPHTLPARLTLAWVLCGAGAWEEAESLTRDVIALAAVDPGPEHPQTLAARHRLAVILCHGERWAEAGREARAVHDARVRVLGAEHAHTLVIDIDLARVLAGAGRRAQARDLAQRTLRACEAVLGADHPDTAVCRGLVEALRGGREDETP